MQHKIIQEPASQIQRTDTDSAQFNSFKVSISRQEFSRGPACSQADTVQVHVLVFVLDKGG